MDMNIRAALDRGGFPLDMSCHNGSTVAMFWSDPDAVDAVGGQVILIVEAAAVRDEIEEIIKAGLDPNDARARLIAWIREHGVQPPAYREYDSDAEAAE